MLPKVELCTSFGMKIFTDLRTNFFKDPSDGKVPLCNCSPNLQSTYLTKEAFPPLMFWNKYTFSAGSPTILFCNIFGATGQISIHLNSHRHGMKIRNFV